jgi:hypothetical protein
MTDQSLTLADLIALAGLFLLGVLVYAWEQGRRKPMTCPLCGEEMVRGECSYGLTLRLALEGKCPMPPPPSERPSGPA